MKTPHLTVFLMTALLGARPLSAAIPTPVGKPNIVVFLCDDLGLLDSSPYGATDVQTPNLQRLANEGLVFDHAFVASPACAPSRAAMLCGLMPAQRRRGQSHVRPSGNPGLAALPGRVGL